MKFVVQGDMQTPCSTAVAGALVKCEAHQTWIYDHIRCHADKKKERPTQWKYVWDFVLTRNDGTQICIHPAGSSEEIEARFPRPEIGADDEIVDEELPKGRYGGLGGSEGSGTFKKYKQRYVDKKLRFAKAYDGTLGDHEKNRGGIYPSGVRCKALNLSICNSGFVKEEINHQAVAVEEIPSEYLLSSNRTYVTAKTYNHEKSVKDEWLLQCFQESQSEVHIKMLSRNHIMLIMRAWIQGAR